MTVHILRYTTTTRNQPRYNNLNIAFPDSISNLTSTLLPLSTRTRTATFRVDVALFLHIQYITKNPLARFSIAIVFCHSFYLALKSAWPDGGKFLLPSIARLAPNSPCCKGRLLHSAVHSDEYVADRNHNTIQYRRGYDDNPFQTGYNNRHRPYRTRVQRWLLPPISMTGMRLGGVEVRSDGRQSEVVLKADVVTQERTDE